MKVTMQGMPLLNLPNRGEQAIYVALVESGRVKDHAKLSCVVHQVVPWLHKQNAANKLPEIPKTGGSLTREARDAYTKQVFTAFKKDIYGSIWTIIAWEVIKMIVWWIIESYLFSESHAA